VWSEYDEREERTGYFLKHFIVYILECYVEKERYVFFENKLSSGNCVFDSSFDFIWDFEADFFNAKCAKVLDHRWNVWDEGVFMDCWEVPVFEIFLCNFLHESFGNQE